MKKTIANYLYTNNEIRLMSPFHTESFGFSINNSGQLLDGQTSPYGVLPAISLKPTATVSSGTGAYNSPYIIQ